MAGTEVLPFFERDNGGLEDLPSDGYVVGLRSSDDEVPKIRITLPSALVDRTVLTGARLSVWLSAGSGRLILDGEGVDNDTLDAALDAGPMRQQTLMTLVEACLNPDHLSMEEDPISDLTALRAQLAEAQAKVEGALARLLRG